MQRQQLWPRNIGRGPDRRVSPRDKKPARSFPSTYCVSHDNSLTPEDRRPQQKTLVVWVVCWPPLGTGTIAGAKHGDISH